MFVRQIEPAFRLDDFTDRKDIYRNISDRLLLFILRTPVLLVSYCFHKESSLGIRSRHVKTTSRFVIVVFPLQTRRIPNSILLVKCRI